MIESNDPRHKLRLGGSRALKGAALVMALLEAIAAQAKPDAANLRLNARNTPLPGGDAYETGRGLLAMGDVTGAMAAFRQALLEAPQSVDTLNAIAVCYDRIGRYDVSRSYYDAALAIAPASVQVLNNLGYSLYLQGELRAAIPYLHQVAAAGDPQAAATSRRLLQLIGIKLRESEARASMAQAVAELHAPAARVEMAANGEQRLVMAAKAPRAEVVATLGDAAALTVAPKVWTARDEARLQAAEAARERAENEAVLAEVAALTAADAALKVPQLVELADLSAADALTIAFPIAAPAAGAAVNAAAVPVSEAVVAAAAMAAPKRGRKPQADNRADNQADTVVLAAAATPAKARKAARRAAATAAVKASAALPAPVPVADPAALAAPLVASVTGFANFSLEAPAWIVATRRGAPPSSVPQLVGQSPDAERSTAGFDSDDPELNAFAARMRGAVNDNGAIEVAADVAIARLEALIARLRRA